jgi:hypothetical protein
MDLHSERFSPDGNLSAEGYENLLGTPSLDLLSILIREATQNICDATLDTSSSGATAKFRIRKLDNNQRAAIAQMVFGTRPEEDTTHANLKTVLDVERQLHVLEIADFGTSGLGGPSRADFSPREGENPDFVNFFRNVGAARDVEGGGGTYGYGKATLYRASRAHSIVVDTLTEDGGKPVRRLMAAQLGRAIPGRITGRHWWGRLTADRRTVDPVTGEEAKGMSQKLGMPERSEGDTGTTIMILAPHFINSETDNSEQVLAAIEENLLWYFWPRMMETTPADRRLTVQVSTGNGFRDIAKPERFGPVSHFCQCMNALRGHETADVKKTQILFRKRKFLGHLALLEAPAARRRWLLPPAVENENGQNGNGIQSIIPQKCSHVALMRQPAEMVVKYLQGPAPEEGSSEWVGVFRCSEEKEVEQAFAKSEPPAHDDWQPDSLPPRSQEKSFVTVALRRIRENMPHQREQPIIPGSSAGGPLGKAAEALGGFLPAGRGEGAGKKRGEGGTRSSRLPKFSQPVPVRLEEINGGPVAVFSLELHAGAKGETIEAHPRVLIDGRAEEPDSMTGFPEVLGWYSAHDRMVSAGENHKVLSPGRVLIRVTVPQDAAVTVVVSTSKQIEDGE